MADTSPCFFPTLICQRGGPQASTADHNGPLHSVRGVLVSVGTDCYRCTATTLCAEGPQAQQHGCRIMGTGCRSHCRGCPQPSGALVAARWRSSVWPLTIARINCPHCLLPATLRCFALGRCSVANQCVAINLGTSFLGGGGSAGGSGTAAGGSSTSSSDGAGAITVTTSGSGSGGGSSSSRGGGESVLSLLSGGGGTVSQTVLFTDAVASQAGDGGGR
jgi:hypothetical protein